MNKGSISSKLEDINIVCNSLSPVFLSDLLRVPFNNVVFLVQPFLISLLFVIICY